MTPTASPRGSEPARAPRWALWNLGFRPFFLSAALFSAVSALLWTVQFIGHLPFTYLHGPLWHGHEMIFGFTAAVIAGFLLTAVRNWTGRETVSGLTLAALTALWLLGRVAAAASWPIVAAAADGAFALSLAAAIGVPLARARNTRNYFFVALLIALGAFAAGAALSLANSVPFSPQRALALATHPGSSDPPGGSNGRWHVRLAIRQACSSACLVFTYFAPCFSIAFWHSRSASPSWPVSAVRG